MPSELTIERPSDRASAPLEREREGAPREPALRAFVIDDDSLMAELIARALAKRGVEPIRFEAPERLLDELAASPPELLMTDLAMPRMDGIAIAREARRRGYRGTVALVTASRDHERIVAAIGAGADEILAKPIKDLDVDVLVEKTRERIARSRSDYEGLIALLEAVDQGVIALDETSTPVFANEKARALLAAESIEEVAETFRRRCPARVLDSERDGSGVVTFIDICAPAPARRSPVGVEMFSLRREAGAARRLVLLHDFSEWRKLDELHERFATYLSHRMRTPLTSARNAVRILSERREPLDGPDTGKFLDIGFRNIEKLISSFDELQKMFMIESGELSACRTLVCVAGELSARLGELEQGGACAGYTVSGPPVAIPSGRRGLGEFVSRAVEALGAWLGSAPFVECVVSCVDRCEPPAEEETAVTVTLKHRGASGVSSVGLGEFLAADERGRGDVLERIAESIGARCEVGTRDAIRLRLPANPPFRKDRDLIRPLHMMLERSDLERSEFHMLTVKMVGALRDEARFERLCAESLCALFATDGCAVSKGEEPASYSVFVAGMPHGKVASSLAELHDRFAAACRERGEEVYPTLKGEIAYRHSPGESTVPSVLAELEGIV